jgi:hypothetical protein
MSDEQLYEFLSEWECGDIDYSVTFCDLCNEATKRGEVGNVLNLDCDGCRKHWLQRDAVDYGGLMYWKKNTTFDTKADRKTENSSEKPNNCEYAENPSGDVWECGCFLDTYCEHQIYDRNPDGTINIVECGYEPKTEPTISKMEQVDKDINVRSKDEPQAERPARCSECKVWHRCFKEKPAYNMIKSRCPLDEPQTERSE